MVPNSVVADVGSDHGKLMIALYDRGIISHGYAIENKPGPYSRLVKALEEEGIIDNVVPLLSDGLTDLPKCVNTVVIAGMGGSNVIDIIDKHKEKVKQINTFIIDAHSKIDNVRRYICSLGFVIADEKLVKEEDIFYEIIKFVKADKAIYNDADIEFGPILRNEKCALFKEKYENRVKEISNLLKKDLPEERINELNKEKEKLLSIL